MSAAVKIIYEEAWSLEGQCLLAAARQLLVPETPEAPPPPFAELDWGKLLELASIHALTPALAQWLQPYQQEVPSQVWTQLQTEWQNVRAYNFYLLVELKRVTYALQNAGIGSVAWKGPSLAVDIYPDLGLRPCADLDVLISGDQMVLGAQLLGEAGYAEMKVDTGGHTRNFIRTQPKAILELHQAVAQPRFSLDIPVEKLVAEKVFLTTGAGEIPVIKSEMQLLLLCAHASKHHWDRLIWGCDIVAFVKKHKDIDWQQTFALARLYRVERMLSIGLLLAEAICPAAIPAIPLESATKDLVAVELARRSAAWLLTPKTDHRESLGKSKYHFQMRESWRDRWPLLKYHVVKTWQLTPADREWVKLPPSLEFLYYLLRPFRLMGALLRKKRQA